MMTTEVMWIEPLPTAANHMYDGHKHEKHTAGKHTCMYDISPSLQSFCTYTHLTHKHIISLTDRESNEHRFLKLNNTRA